MERKTMQYIPRKNYTLSSCTNPKWEELHGKLNGDPSLEE